MTTRKRHGGKRPGAGRPKANPGGVYCSALEYLAAVARGLEPASVEQRVAAARAVFPYEQPRRRATKESPSPTRLREAEQVVSAKDERAEWRVRAAEIRARHGRKETT